MLRQLLSLAALAAVPVSAGAETSFTAQGEPAAFSTQSRLSSPPLVFSLRGGAAVSPEYFGSDEYDLGPDLGFTLHYLRLGGREFGDPDPWAERSGFDVHGSFRYIGERDASDFDELSGLDDVDAALELGLGVGYTTRNAAGFVDVRRGFGGHEGYVLEAGADAIFRPTDALRLSLGPRVLYGDDEYTDTYFGIDASEASASLPAYDADAGLVSYGVELGMRYRISDRWGLEGAVSYDRFADTASDSAIVGNGSDDQWGARLGVTRVFGFGG